MAQSAYPSLKPFNTFGVEATCDRLLSFNSEQAIQEWIDREQPAWESLFVLGGGSNLLLLDHIPLTFVQPAIAGIRYRELGADDVLVDAGAGVNWHELVLDSLQQGLWGVENLSLIPGNVGAAPIQNIGAYGVELQERFVSLRAVDIDSGELKTFDRAACQFGYRDSVFKRQLKGRYIITEVTLRLSRKPQPQITYGPLQQMLGQRQDLTAAMVSDAVIQIRQSKLPDPAVLGNAGSFFKNPVIGEQQYRSLLAEFPNLVAYPVATGYKLAAGWLIEQAGLKGYRQGDAGVHQQQALVLVNYGKATGRDILQLAHEVKARVEDKFAVILEPEVWIIGEQDLF